MRQADVRAAGDAGNRRQEDSSGRDVVHDQRQQRADHQYGDEQPALAGPCQALKQIAGMRGHAGDLQAPHQDEDGGHSHHGRAAEP